MGRIALEEHMLLGWEDHLDRRRTLAPMIPEQYPRDAFPFLSLELSGSQSVSGFGESP